MAKKKKKKLKAHIFHATHQAQHQNSHQEISSSETNSPSSTSFVSSREETTHKYDRQFGHVLPDLKFFGFVVVLMVIILGIIYYFDKSGNLVMNIGDQVYKILNLS